MPAEPSTRAPRGAPFAAACVALACASLAASGCKAAHEDRREAPPTAPTPSAAPASSSSAKAASKASPLSDLLHETAAEVAVSSNVDNPRDFPEHLIDNKPDTAWNGKTGDLVGGWVAFRLPSGVRVRRVELSTGFDKASPSGDLFAMNHRVRRVRLSHDGRALVERDLDPNVRTPQAIDLERPRGGGVYRIEVLAVEPGTKAAWRELTLSELKVWGDPGPAKLERPAMPRVGVGDFPQPRPPLPPPPAALKGLFGRAYPSLAAFCRAYDPIARPAIDAKFDGNRYPGRIEGPHCRPSGPLVPRFTPDGWAEAVFAYEANDDSANYRSFAVKTPAGVVPSHVVLHSHDHDDPGCSGGVWSEARQARFDGGRLHVTVLRVDQKRLVPVSGPGGALSFLPPRADVTKIDVSCALESDALACTETELASACYEGIEYSLPTAPSEPDWTHRCAEPEAP